MNHLVHKTLEIYVKEKRIITQSDFDASYLGLIQQQNALFITLYFDGKVVASQGRIQCKKENTLYECIDLALSCIKDPRFSQAITSPEMLAKIQVRVDIISRSSRRILRDISELNIAREGLIFLSQNLWKMSVILPNMIKNNPTPEQYLLFAKQKAGITAELTPSDYVLYGLSTEIKSDF